MDDLIESSTQSKITVRLAKKRAIPLSFNQSQNNANNKRLQPVLKLPLDKPSIELQRETRTLSNLLRHTKQTYNREGKGGTRINNDPTSPNDPPGSQKRMWQKDSIVEMVVSISDDVLLRAATHIIQANSGTATFPSCEKIARRKIMISNEHESAGCSVAKCVSPNTNQVSSSGVQTLRKEEQQPIKLKQKVPMFRETLCISPKAESTSFGTSQTLPGKSAEEFPVPYQSTRGVKGSTPKARYSYFTEIKDIGTCSNSTATESAKEDVSNGGGVLDILSSFLGKRGQSKQPDSESQLTTTQLRNMQSHDLTSGRSDILEQGRSVPLSEGAESKRKVSLRELGLT